MTLFFPNYFHNLHAEIWPWFDPGSRLFYGNVIVAAVIALIFLMYSKKRRINEILNPKVLNSYWLNPSAMMDYQIFIINGLIKVFLFAPVLGLSFLISKYTVKSLFFLSPDFTVLNANLFVIVLVTVLVFIWDDFLRFIHHYFMHKVSFLWELHKTHHSAAVLTPITLYRIHPLESLIATFRNAISLGVASGFLMFLFSGQMNLLTLLGVNIFAFVFNLVMGNLRHSHIDLSFGFLENILISPKQHQIHHSNQPEHFNKNFGVALSIWDRLFKTLVLSKGQKISAFGVHGVNPNSLVQAYWPWPKLKPSKILKFRLTSLFTLILIPIILLSFTKLKAEVQCIDYLKLEEVKRQRSEYFVPNRFLTVSGYNVYADLRTKIPGRFRVNISSPRLLAPKSMPAYFNDIIHERFFYQIRSLKNDNIFRTYLSGKLEYVEGKLAFIIYKMTKRPENYGSMLNTSVRPLTLP